MRPRVWSAGQVIDPDVLLVTDATFGDPGWWVRDETKNVWGRARWWYHAPGGYVGEVPATEYRLLSEYGPVTERLTWPVRTETR